jgi:hypothetical protein
MIRYNFNRFASADIEDCKKVINASIAIFALSYSFLFAVIIIVVLKYRKQQQSAKSDENDEWMLVNKLMSDMKQQGAASAGAGGNFSYGDSNPRERNSKNQSIFLKGSFKNRPS